MKRHPALEPFSRDHNVGLVLARELSLAANQAQRNNAIDRFLRAWEDELRDHFDEEERLLAPITSDLVLVERLRADHRSISEHAESAKQGMPSAELVEKLGQELNDHIRWEERELFPAIERTLTLEQARSLASETDKLEKRRQNSLWSPRRGELIKRRGSN